MSGAHSIIHTTNILALSTGLPLIVEIIDTAERIDAFLPVRTGMVTEGLITVEDVYVFKHAARKD